MWYVPRVLYPGGPWSLGNKEKQQNQNPLSMNILQISDGFCTFQLCARQERMDQHESPQVSQQNCKWEMRVALEKQWDPGLDDTLDVIMMLERRLLLASTYKLDRRNLDPLLLFSPVKYPWTSLFPNQTLFSFASNMGASTTLNIATAGIDPAITKAQEHLLFHLQGRI